MSIKDLRPALRALLLGNAGVVALVASRVYPLRLLQGQREPSIVYNRVAGAVDYTMQGPSGLAFTTLQVDCWAEDPDVASNLARTVRAVLEGFAGDVDVDEGSPVDAVRIQGVFVDRMRDDYDAGVNLYRESVDYRFAWQER